MDRSRLLRIVIILAIVGIVFVALGNIFDDDTQPRFNAMLRAQATTTEISRVAMDQASSPETKAQAAMVFSTSSSDFQNMSAIAEAWYDVPPPSDNVDDTAIEELESTRENFDFAYRETAREQLNASLEQIEFFLERTSNQPQRRALEVARNNHETHIERLEELP